MKTIKTLLILMAVAQLTACADAPLPAEDALMKTRGTPLPHSNWQAVQAQDVAILLPRVVGEGIPANLLTSEGDWLLKKTWLNAVNTAFEDTEVEDALALENMYEEWEVVAVRIAPCSPLGTTPGPIAQRFCWPEVRLVWQPNQYDFHIGWTTVEAFSDDRAIHALHRVYQKGTEDKVSALIERMQAAQQPSERDLAQLEAMRQGAISQLLGDVVSLRSRSVSGMNLYTLDLRAESMSGDSEAKAFYGRLAGFLADYALGSTLHTMTAFSLPEGRNPAGSDRWIFVAFDGVFGEIKQRPITVTDPKSGETIYDYGMDETVSSAAGDDRLLEALRDGQVDRSAIERQIFTEVSDRTRLAERINDPDQTLVANTSCASCHSFNDLTFDFHNLSYLQEMDMTISKRVRNDVRADLDWLGQN